MSENDGNSSEFSEDDNFEEDNESTLNEEEALMHDNDDVDEELRLLNEENELSVEELRRRYYGDPNPEPTLPADQPCSSALPTSVAADPLKSYFGENIVGSDSEDEEYVPRAAEYWKKEVRIGENYQAATLPDVNESTTDYKPTIQSIALWRPTRADDESDRLKDYLTKVNTILHEEEAGANGINEPPQANRAPKCTAFADNEDALFALLKYEYNPDKAIEHIPFLPTNGPQITGPNVWRPMSTDDVDAFETGFREYGKNFYFIQKNELPDRSVGELVNFYYIWKKTERHDMFVEANRALGIPELSTKTIDPMDILVDQQLEQVNGVLYTPTTTILNTQASNHPHHKNWLSVQQNSTPSQSSKHP